MKYSVSLIPEFFLVR